MKKYISYSKWRLWRGATLIVAVGLCPQGASAQQPKFDMIVGLNDGICYVYTNSGTCGTPTMAAQTAWNLPDVGSSASPGYADFDDDGDYDLLIGKTSGSGIAVGYENIGNGLSPVWSAKTAWDLTTGSGNWETPAFADLDNDGDFDLMMGHSDGRAYGYRNTGSRTSPTWTAHAAWNSADPGSNAVPCLVDLDADGDFDLLLGHSTGATLAYRNTGTSAAPTWTAHAAWNPTTNAAGNASPAVCDRDCDGDYDLYIGSTAGTAYCYRNTGSQTSLTWTYTVGDNITGLGANARIVLPDLNENQAYYVGLPRLDLIIGGYNGVGVGYRNTGSVWSPVWTLNSTWNTPDVGQEAAPQFGDLDDDGDYDLFIGEEQGITKYYRNTGSGTAPAWTYHSAWNAPDVGMDSRPILRDLDADGDLDLLTGMDVGDAMVYRNTGTASAPVWTRHAAWDPPGGIDEPSPGFADLDADGDYDLVLGMETGQLYAFRNTGTASAPAWTRHVAWEIAGIASDHDSAPVFGDLDLDGDYDLLIGDEEGDVFAYQNTGTSSSPSWARRTAWELHSLDLDVEPALFDFDEDGALLPVKLVSFHADVVGSAVLLTWCSATELNADFYTVEHSADGHVWSTVGQVTAAVNSNSLMSYELMDEAPLPRTSYYRLIETDLDGRRTQVGLDKVQIALTTLTVSVAPNPITDKTVITLSGAHGAANVQLVLVNMLGAEVMRRTIRLEAQGSISLRLDAYLRPGNYLLTWSDGETGGTQVLVAATN